MNISKSRFFLVIISCAVLWYFFVTEEENLPLEDSSIIAEENSYVHHGANHTTFKSEEESDIVVKVVEETQAEEKKLKRFSSDPRCSIKGIVKKKAYGYDDDDTVGESDPHLLGPCRYAYPTKYPPKEGWRNEIDWFHFRKTHKAREQCFLDCLNRLPKEYIDDAMLIEASRMGLPKVAIKLLNKFHLDPLYEPPDSAKKPRVVNAIQEAIRGGYAEIVKVLTKANNDMVIDTYGRTVKDYVFTAGSPIRPAQVRDVLGLEMPSSLSSNNRQAQEEEVVVVPEGETVNTNSGTENFGWSTSTALPYDNECDFDVIYDDITPERFFKEYFSTGRPFVMRNHVPHDELQAFRKKRWNQTESFKLSGKHRVGPTAYPSLTGQHYCRKKFDILEIENGTACPDMPDRKMVYAFHPKKSEFKELFPMYDGDVLDETGGWRKVGEWFGEREIDLAWQVFYGGDGSGATFHWHNAAFNILYVGVKEWRIAPPLHRGFTGMTAMAAREMLEKDYSDYTLKCTQHPGDQIFIPDYWGHMTINHGFTIGAAVILYDEQRDKIRPKKERKKMTKESAKKKKEETLATVVAKPKLKTRKIPFLFIHINKTGGTSLISMFNNRCKKEYVSEWWGGHNGRPWHRSFHATADSYIRQYGREVFDEAFTFAVVRHPLARQVSNFFFLADMCEEDGSCSNSDRLIPKKVNGKPISKLSDDEKIQAFHDWTLRLYEKYPPGSPKHYLFGSKGHGNEEWETFSSTQTSWLVDETNNMVVKKVFKLEELSDNMDSMVEAIPCLGNGQNEEEEGVKMVKKNKTSKYPDFMLFAKNKRTKEIINEVFADDFKNFGYDVLV